MEGDSALLSALDVLTTEHMEDERIQRFFEHIRSAAYTGEEGEEGEEGGKGGDGEGEDHANAEAANEMTKAAAKDAAGTEISVNTFDELRLDATIVQAANDCWRLFISTAASREAAGEAIYAALFESAPSLQSLFVTPRAVQAMRFMNGLASFCEALADPPRLKILVETLGFGHLHLDVTVPRVVIFRDAILDLFIVELAERFDSKAREGWRRLLNYVGGAIIFVKAHYAERITCLLKSWKQANHGDEDKQKEKDTAAASDSGEQQAATQEKGKTDRTWSALRKRQTNAGGET